MPLPKNKRGFRKIVLDCVDYDWRFVKNLDIRANKKPRSKLIVNLDWEDPWLQMRENIINHHLHPCSSPITPKFVAFAIKESIKLGWQPESYYCQFNVKYQGGKFLLDKGN